jgi:hypothetical protein
MTSVHGKGPILQTDFLKVITALDEEFKLLSLANFDISAILTVAEEA